MRASGAAAGEFAFDVPILGSRTASLEFGPSIFPTRERKNLAVAGARPGNGEPICN